MLEFFRALRILFTDGFDVVLDDSEELDSEVSQESRRLS